MPTDIADDNASFFASSTEASITFAKRIFSLVNFYPNSFLAFF